MNRFTSMLILSAVVLRPLVGGAQARVDARPLASRSAIEAEVARLGAIASPDAAARERLASLERRLVDGDFRAGDLLLLEVQGEPTLTDTFAVQRDGTLLLPSPVVGTLSLRGVLRAEASSQVAAFIARFVRAPVVSVRPLVRVAVAGEVTRAGFYPVPADAPLSEVLMVAHGVTAMGDLGKVEVKRERRTLLDPRSWRDAVSQGWTVDDAGLRDGDAVVVGRSNRGDLEGRLRFLWVVVSLAGGVYGLTRAL